MPLPSPLRSLTAATLSLFATLAVSQPLKLDIYNPGHDAMFPVTSVLVTGEKDAILIDAQFGRSQAAEVVGRIRQSGKHLTAIYISHGDPDYYFGLPTLTEAFPDAKVLASAPTVAHIRRTMDAKLAYWGPQMGADAPGKLVAPEAVEGDTLKLEGHTLAIMGLNGAQPDRSFVWIPSIKAVVGGVVLANNIHVWMADTQSAKSHTDWLATLAAIEKLQPTTVVPGHFLPGQLRQEQSPTFTANYIRAFDEETTKAANSAELIKAMKARYPSLGDESSLEVSAQVAKGERQW